MHISTQFSENSFVCLSPLKKNAWTIGEDSALIAILPDVISSIAFLKDRLEDLSVDLSVQWERLRKIVG